MRSRVFSLSLGFLGMACSSTTEGLRASDADVTDVRQDVPLPDASAVDVRTIDVGGRDITFADVPSADLGVVDVPPADIAVLDAPPSTCAARIRQSPSACAGTCGNNRVDSCRVCGPCGPRPPGPPGGDGGFMPGPPPPFDAGTCCEDATEACDGNDLAGRTCASLGYASGTLRCGDGCGFDTSDCNDCAGGPSVVSCGRARVTAHAPSRLSLATNDTEAAIAWVSDFDGAGGAVGFAHFSSSLALVGEVPCVTEGARSVRLSRAMDGWLLAVEARAGVELWPLSASGAPRGAVRSVAGAHSPVLAAAPDGRQLLVYTTYGTSGAHVQATVLSPLGAPMTGDVTLLNDVTEPEYGSAVWAGTRWLVAMREAGIAVIPVSSDGVAGAVAHPLSTDTEYPQVGWNGMYATLTWSDFGSGNDVRFAQLEASGSLRGAAMTLGAIPTWYNVTPTVNVGGDTVALMSGYTGGTGLSRNLAVLRVGASAGAPNVLTRSPDTEAEHRIAALGTDVIVAWVAHNAVPGRITLARVRP